MSRTETGSGEMLRQQARLFRILPILLESCRIDRFPSGASFQWFGWRDGEFLDYALVLLIVFPIWFGLFAYFNLYSSLRMRSLLDVLSAVITDPSCGCDRCLFHSLSYGASWFQQNLLRIFVLISWS